MNKVISTERIPIKLWLDDIEDGALEQAKNLANLPFAFKHIAIMPDSHQGYGMPIGGVLATDGVVIPNAVGVDIGCGMIAVKTSLTELSQLDIKKIFGGSKELKGGIRTKIPVGFNHHSKYQDESLMPLIYPLTPDEFYKKYKQTSIIWGEYISALKQIGTLGGGNHFIEFQKGDDGHIWLMVHSGSRNLGYKVANYYNSLAINLNKRWQSKVDPSHELAFLPLDSIEGQMYLDEMNYCVEFALANRSLIMKRIEESIIKYFPGTKFEKPINIAHNYVAMENHYGKNVIVHRKGATLARKDTIGIIPGSQGTASYIVKGKGEPESFMSCSHGAGRKMGRKQAQRELDLKTEKKRLDSLGVIHSIRNEKDLDEAAGAYKDISVVMKNQSDLVDIVTELIPLAVIKG